MRNTSIVLPGEGGQVNGDVQMEECGSDNEEETRARKCDRRKGVVASTAGELYGFTIPWLGASQDTLDQGNTSQNSRISECSGSDPLLGLSQGSAQTPISKVKWDILKQSRTDRL